MRIFILRRGSGFIVFSTQCSYISGGYLSFFLSFIVLCWCLHATCGFVDRRFLVMFSIYRLRRKGGRLISQNFFYFFFFFLTLRTVSMFIVCSRTWYQTWEAVWLIICSDLILRYWCFLSVGVFALHLPNYFYFEVFPSSCEFTRFSIGWLAVFFSLEFELQWALHDISVRWLAGFRPQFF